MLCCTFRFNEDCNFSCCNYREHQTHFHCMRKDCNYRFCDKTRFVQHTARHERLDTLCGSEFEGFRGVTCSRESCEFNINNLKGEMTSSLIISVGNKFDIGLTQTPNHSPTHTQTHTHSHIHSQTQHKHNTNTHTNTHKNLKTCSHTLCY